MDAVILSDIKEHEFQELCVEIFKRMGYRGVKPVCRRLGMWGDIMLTSPEGEKVMVLCIHCLGREVGKDEMYGLCETMFYSSINKGIIVTTGYLSNEGLQFIDALHGKIEVWDLPRFRQLANQVGIKLGEVTYGIQELAFPAMPTDKVVEYIIMELLNIRGFSSVWHGFDIESKIEYHPVYRIEYKPIKPQCTERIVVKKLEGFNTVYIDGKDGISLPHINEWYDDMPLEPLRRAEPHVVHNFTLTPDQAVAHFYGILSERYARTEYQDVDGPEGFNAARVYSNKIYVEIVSITKVMLPIHNIKIRILNNTYFFKCYTRPPNHVYIITNQLTHCSKCLKDLPKNKRAICSNCGRILHFGLIGGHAKTCWKCWKPICDECLTKKKKWFMIPAIYCRMCLKEEARIDEEKRKKHQIDEKLPTTL